MARVPRSPSAAKQGRPRKGDFQIVVRFPQSTLDRLDAFVAAVQASTGLHVPRAEVMRTALELGLDVMEKRRAKQS